MLGYREGSVITSVDWEKKRSTFSHRVRAVNETVQAFYFTEQFRKKM